MTTFGFAEIIGAILIGKSIDLLSSKNSNYVTMVVCLTTGLVTAWNLTHLNYGFMSYLMCAMYGL